MVRSVRPVRVLRHLWPADQLTPFRHAHLLHEEQYVGTFSPSFLNSQPSIAERPAGFPEEYVPTVFGTMVHYLFTA